MGPTTYAPLRLDDAPAIVATLAVVGLAGAVVVDDGRVVARGPDFAAVACPLLTIEDDHLLPTDAAGRAGVPALLAAAVAGGAATIATRLRGSAILRLDLVPLGGPDRSGALIIASDPMAPRRADATLLRRVFGLTAAETRLALYLLDDATLADAAARDGVRVSTQRVHLRNLFAKTGTTRQATLVRRLAGIHPIADQSSATASRSTSRVSSA